MTLRGIEVRRLYSWRTVWTQCVVTAIKLWWLKKGWGSRLGDPQDVADDYSKQFINSEISIKKQHRLGSGEVMFENVEHTIADDSFVLDFDLVNKTNKKQSGITMGYDFCVNDDIIIGNDTRFLDEFKKELNFLQRQKGTSL